MGKTLKLIASIAVAVFAPYAAAALGLTGFAATAFGFALQLGANAILGSFGGDSAGGGSSVKDSGFLVNQQGNTNPIHVVYGNRRIGGSRVYIETTDASGNPSGDEYLHVAIAVAQGGVKTDGTDSIKGFNEIYFNDRLAWSSSGGIDSYYTDLVTFRLYNGSAGQTWSSPNVTAGSFAPSTHFTAGNHDGKSVAWAYIIFKYDRDKFPGMPTVIFDIDGKKIKNNSGSYSSDINVMSNPARVLYDYLTSNRYGKGLDPAMIDAQSFIDAADYCDAAGLTFNGVVQTNRTIFNNTNDMLAAANCNLVFANGIYKLQPVKQESFTGAFTFSEKNIIGSWTISLGSKKTRFNKFIVNYFNPDLDWNADSLVVENATYLAEDSDNLNEKQIDLPFCGNKALAEKVGNYYLDLSRYQTVVTFTATWEAMQLEVGDPVYVTHATTGWTNQKFRVAGLVLLPNATVEVTLSEYAPDSIYLENN